MHLCTIHLERCIRSPFAMTNCGAVTKCCALQAIQLRFGGGATLDVSRLEDARRRMREAARQVLYHDEHSAVAENVLLGALRKCVGPLAL